MATIELTAARHSDQQAGTAVTVAELLATFGLTATGHSHRHHHGQYEEPMITVAELLGRRSESGAAREAHTAPSPSIHPPSLASSPAKSSVLTGSQARGRGLLLAALGGLLLATVGGLLLATLGGLLVVAVAVTAMNAQPSNAAAAINPPRRRRQPRPAARRGLLRRPVRRQPPGSILRQTSRRHHNRGGDRHANSALYRIALSRPRWDTRTRDYLARRTTEGKTRRETIRCLKRYIAREIHQIITTPPKTEPSTT
jgi:hypothetical protein